MENELKNFIKVWITAILCLCYCYYIVSRLIPKGLFRLISLLPVFYLFITTPLTLHFFHLLGPTTFFLVWLGTFKLVLFSFNLGPLSPPPPSLFHFISLASLPIKLKQTPPDPKTTQKPRNSNGQSVAKGLPNNSVVVAVKALVLGMLIHTYEYKAHFHPYAILALYCCYLYLAIDIILLISAIPARALFGFDLEPQFDEPYLSTSLQDFWGRRWNLMVTNILRPTVYDPTQRVFARVAGKRLARFVAVMATFLVSGLMHEVFYYYLMRVQPTWEVTCFFVLHGVCVAAEVEVKKAVTGRRRLHPVVSGMLTLVFLAATGNWLFFPQLIRNGMDTKVIGEYAIMVDLVKANLPHLHYWSNKS